MIIILSWVCVCVGGGGGKQCCPGGLHAKTMSRGAYIYVLEAQVTLMLVSMS